MNIARKTSSYWNSATKVIALAAPALSILLLISIYGVNIPAGDQWDVVPVLLEKMNEGTLSLRHFFAQHNEHRIFFPRLIMFTLALLTHWNIKVELFTSWLLACISAYNFWRLSHVTGWGRSNAGFWLLLGVNILLFTPLQYENWLWGFQIGFFLPVTCVTSLLWIVPSSRTSISFLTAILCSIIANYSIASGFVCWLIAIPLLLFPRGEFSWRDRKGWLILFSIAFIGSQILYLVGYQKPAHHPSIWITLHHPGKAAEYFLSYFGSPFAWGTGLNAIIVATTVGAVLVAIFAICMGYVWICRSDSTLVARALPWFGLCFFSIATNIITTIGRVGFGTIQAMVSRYVTFAVMMPAGLLFLGALIFSHWRERTASGRYLMPVTMCLTSLNTILVCLLFLSTLVTFKAWADTRHDRLCAQALVQLINVVQDNNDFTKCVYPSVIAEKRIKLVSRLGYLRPKCIDTEFVLETAKTRVREGVRNGNIDELSQSSNGQLNVGGWSVLSEKKTAAFSTILTYDDDHRHPIPFAIAFAGVPRPDIARAFKTDSYLESGWSTTVSKNQIPVGLRAIRGWAFDPESCRGYPIDGTKMLSVRFE